MKKAQFFKRSHKDKDLKILLDVSRSVSSSIKLNVVNNLILKKALWALGTDHASLFIFDQHDKRLMLAGARGFKRNEINNIAIVGSWEKINYKVAKTKRPLVVNNLSAHRSFKKNRLPIPKGKFPLNSFLSVPLKTKEIIIGVLTVSNKKGHPHTFTKDDKNFLKALANQFAIALLNASLYKNLENLFMSTIASLANAIDAKDPYTHGHSERVMKYALAIADQMKLSEDFVKNLRLASLLHDVGKIGIKDAVLGKKSALTREEAKIMHQHPAIGVKIVSSIIGSGKFIKGISDHHEAMNGKGYPNHLKGNKISLEGRIIAVADAYDALTTDRPYHKGYTDKEACLEIAKSSETQFDPRVVKAFLTSFSEENPLWRT